MIPIFEIAFFREGVCLLFAKAVTCASFLDESLFS